MRTLSLIAVAALLTPAAGCKWMDDLRTGGSGNAGPRPTGKIEAVAPERLVTFLNDRAGRLQSIEYDTIHMRVSGKNLMVPATLDGSLACTQPRNFRMVGSPRVASGKIDMGSNDQQFWAYVDAPGGPPMYVYASHTDFESGRAKLPPGISFEPDWVIQALGMKPLPASARYEVIPNDRDRTYTLWWVEQSAAAGQVRKEIVFDADAATGSRPQVKRHVIRDARGSRVIATADIKTAQTVPVGTEPRTGAALVVQYPTHIVLTWTDPRFEIDMTLEKAAVNTADDPTRRGLFTRPDIRGANPIDLAGGFPR